MLSLCGFDATGVPCFRSLIEPCVLLRSAKVSANMSDVHSHNLDASAIHMLHRASQAADEMFSHETSGAELTPRQFTVLAAMESLESASQTQIVDATGIDRSTLADIVKRLVKRGLLSRRRSRSDARAYVVRLTPDGKAMLLQIKPAAERVEQRLFDQVPGARRGELIAALEAIIGQLDGTSAPKAA